ncbi:MAG: TAXI family TRAP transporter solute-binding subunit [Syntrophaceae bacterium]|nr:TAXI family TRAP transporter solute-binding subunit [Syntrophaceae bacterium]
MSGRKMLILSLFLVGFFFAGSGLAEAAAKTRLAVGGNGIGGVYYLYSGAVSQIINQSVPGAQATVEVVPGSSVEHVKRMQINDMQLGPAMNDVVFQAMKGTGQFKEPQTNIRTLFIMYPAVLQGVTLKKLQVRTPADLVGKRVSIGNPGTGSSVMTQAVLEALGIDPKSINLSYLNWNEGANAIRNGILDVQFAAIGIPAPFIMDLAATHDIHLVGFSDGELDKVQQKFAYYPPAVIPKGSYGPVKEDIKVPGIWNSYLATKELSDNLAYEITKAVYANMAALKKAYKDADQATPENTMKFAIAPLHPGAVKYYREKGIAIPDRLMPK